MDLYNSKIEFLATLKRTYGLREVIATCGRDEQMTDEIMTLAETAEATRTPEATLRYWRYIGKGPASFKLGRRVLYARSDVELFIARARAADSA
jgi:predicted DNA-binding transcriptional regulator AlpA